VKKERVEEARVQPGTPHVSSEGRKKKKKKGEGEEGAMTPRKTLLVLHI